MFGLFGKSGFDSEMARLESENKALAARLLKSMQSFDLSEQMEVMNSMLSLYDRRIDCCKRFGKFDLIEKLQSEKAQLQALRG